MVSGGSLGHSVHINCSEVVGVLLQTNLKLRHSLAGGTLGPVLIVASSGAIDRRKRMDVDIGYRQAVVRASETRAHDA
jgi:hypothetical protein